MLEGKDFIILSTNEAHLLYNALKKDKSKATYKELSELGILEIIQRIEGHIWPKDKSED